MKAATSSVCIDWKVGRPAAWARHRTSWTPTTDASAESLIIATKSLPTAGVTIRNACGAMIRRNVVRPVMPSESAASVWPCGTASMPERKTSVIYAP